MKVFLRYMFLYWEIQRAALWKLTLLDRRVHLNSPFRTTTPAVFPDIIHRNLISEHVWVVAHSVGWQGMILHAWSTASWRSIEGHNREGPSQHNSESWPKAFKYPKLGHMLEIRRRAIRIQVSPDSEGLLKDVRRIPTGWRGTHPSNFGKHETALAIAIEGQSFKTNGSDKYASRA